MENVIGYKEFREKKEKILYSRMDQSMIDELHDIRKKTGISLSEIIREAVRRLILDANKDGGISLKIG